MTGLGKAPPKGTLFGIIGAMDEELTLLRGALQDAREERAGGFTLFSGTLAGHAALLAQCGIGKVNAGALAQVLALRGVSHVLFTLSLIHI